MQENTTAIQMQISSEIDIVSCIQMKTVTLSDLEKGNIGSYPKVNSARLAVDWGTCRLLFSLAVTCSVGASGGSRHK